MRQNFHTKHSVFTATDEQMPHIIQLHIMSIQPANKAAEHMISSYDYSIGTKTQKQSMLIL